LEILASDEAHVLGVFLGTYKRKNAFECVVIGGPREGKFFTRRHLSS